MSQAKSTTMTTTEELPAALLDQIIARTAEAITRAAPAVQPMELRGFEELERWAERVKNSDMMPKDYKGKPDNIIIAVQMGAELGLRPMQAIQNIAVINGRASVWGDAMLALCKTHPLYVSTEETVAGEGDARVATCKMIRRGEPPVIRTFSVADAKKAGLWKETARTTKKGRDGPYEVDSGPWYSYPDRMMQMRARGFAARDAYPDKLRGLISAEEAQDYALENTGLTLPTYSSAAPAPDPTPAITAPSYATVADAKEWAAANGHKWTAGIFLDALGMELDAAHTAEAVDAIVTREDVQRAMDTFQNGNRTRLAEMTAAATARTAERMEA